MINMPFKSSVFLLPFCLGTVITLTLSLGFWELGGSATLCSTHIMMQVCLQPYCREPGQGSSGVLDSFLGWKVGLLYPEGTVLQVPAFCSHLSSSLHWAGSLQVPRPQFPRSLLCFWFSSLIVVFEISVISFFLQSLSIKKKKCSFLDLKQTILAQFSVVSKDGHPPHMMAFSAPPSGCCVAVIGIYAGLLCTRSCSWRSVVGIFSSSTHPQRAGFKFILALLPTYGSEKQVIMLAPSVRYCFAD